MEIDYDKERVPAPSFEGGDIALPDSWKKHTLLSPFLAYDTWPAHWAAMLVAGLQPMLPPHDNGEIPEGTFTLGGTFVRKIDDPMIEATRILSIWNAQIKAPERVRPADFVVWCKSRGINTDWLRDVGVAADNAFAPCATGTSKGASIAPTTRLKQSTLQQEAIKAKLIELGFELQKLPPFRKGKSSPAKQAIYKAFQGTYSKTVIDDRWKELTAAGEIAYAVAEP